MIPNKNIFCNVPWYDLHIYWDGSLGICCQESNKLYKDSDSKYYNISNMSIAEWFNSEPVRSFRKSITGDQRLKECNRCYIEESYGSMSRRLRENQKSVLFEQAFNESYKQSPGNANFTFSVENNGATLTQPIDLHIDLGNYCNLACKHCCAKASSSIAAQEVKWGIEESRLFLGTNWTNNQQIWDKFVDECLNLPNLNNIHLMGGETLLTGRFEDLVDAMIARNKTDVCLSFVTNGTVFNDSLIKKLTLFKRVGIEVSIETTDEHNKYQRQGTDTALVLKNIGRYMEWCNNTTITVTLRPAPSSLTIGYMDTLLDYALENQLIVKHNLCYNPSYLDVKYLPKEVKDQYVIKYRKFLDKVRQVTKTSDYNVSDPNNYQLVLKHLAEACVDLLSTKTTSNEHQLEQLVRHCERWDRVYGYDARVLYPEWQNFLTKFNYDPVSSKAVS